MYKEFVLPQAVHSLYTPPYPGPVRVHNLQKKPCLLLRQGQPAPTLEHPRLLQTQESLPPVPFLSPLLLLPFPLLPLPPFPLAYPA